MAQTLDNILESCPSLGALTDYFEAMEVEDLTRFWPACLTEAVSVEWGILPDGLIGNIARAACVVARRLHGVTYMTSVQATGKAASLLNEGKAPPAEAAFTVGDGPMPAAAKGMRADPLIAAIKDLKPGKYIAIPGNKIKKATLTSKVNRAKKAGGHAKLKFYIAEDGRFIVYIGA